jgi:tRNA-2-methylthio-N6-dimethylallyladenosine synthase
MCVGVSLSSDFISGFCGESEEDHQHTLTLLNYVKYDQAFMVLLVISPTFPSFKKVN